MARMPGAVWLGEHSPKTPMTRYDIVCVHTIVGYAPAHAAHFSTKADGTILQSRDTAYRSAANLNGNHRIIAIENEDHGPAFGDWPSSSNAPVLTDAQVEATARILAWAHEEHGIPLQLCLNSRPGSRGLAYHRQGIDGNFDGFRFPGRVPGGEVWTESFGKVCPTDNRIAQLPDILALATGGHPRTTPTESEEDDMQLSDNIYPGKKDDKTVGQVLQDLDRLLPALNAYRAGAVRRHQALQKLVREAIAAADRGATPAEVRALLENLDATIQIVIADDATEEK